MTTTERLFALKRRPGFAHLRDSELIVVAEHLSERIYPPEKTVIARGSWPSHLMVVVGGYVCDSANGRRMSPIVGAEWILADRPASSDFVADPSEGAICLLLGKGHFFTLIHECPIVLVEWMRLGLTRRESDHG